MSVVPGPGGLTPLHAWTPGAAPPAQGPGVSPWRVRAEAAVGGAAALAALVLLLSAALGAYVYVPYSDSHDWAAAVFEAERTHAWLGYLWSPHTAQRIPWARLAEVADIEVVRGRGPVFLWIATGAWFAGGAAVLASVVRERGLAPRTRVWLAVLAGLILLDTAVGEGFAFPISSLYPLSAGPAAAAVCLAAAGARRGLRGPAFWAGLACAGVASGGGAAGLAVWPALAALAVLQPGGRGRLTAVATCGLSVAVTFQAGLGLPSGSLGAASGGGAHLLKQLTYALAFCGLPWSRALHPPAAGALPGAVVVAAAALGLRRAWRERHEEGLAVERIGAALAVFGLVAAVLAAVGRVDELPAPIVPTRYTPFAALLQLGAALGLAGRLDGVLRRRADGLTLGTAALCALLLIADVHGGRVLRRSAERVRAASRAFDLGRPTGDVVIHPRPALAQAVRAQLRARGLPS